MNDVINGFYRIFNHVFCEAPKISPRPRSRMWGKENTCADTDT